MKVIIAGSRTITEYYLIENAIAYSGFKITEVVSGTARGVDRLGEIYAAKMNLPLTMFKPDWDKYNKSAGHIRNKQMAEYADGLIAIWDGISPGTKNMIENMKKVGKPYFLSKVGGLYGAL
jgi:hypothetical protein